MREVRLDDEGREAAGGHDPERMHGGVRHQPDEDRHEPGLGCPGQPSELDDPTWRLGDELGHASSSVGSITNVCYLYTMETGRQDRTTARGTLVLEMTDSTGRSPDSIARVAVLADPVRRRVYEAVAASAPMDRDAVGAAAGISRSLAAFHLDRLVDAGLLEATFRRRTGRSGPGAGRPAKFYSRPETGTVAVSLPPRRYGLAAGLFARGLERTAGGRAATLAAAHDAGAALAGAIPAGERRSARRARAAVVRVLDEHGFEPRTEPDGTVDLGNCPFRDLTEDHRDLTCGANLALLAGVVEAVPVAGLTAERRDPPEPCCVTLRADARRA